MNRSDKLLWASFFGVLAVIVAMWLSSCGGATPPAKRAEALSCLDLANTALEQATTCDEARAALDKVIADMPACLQLFGVQLRLENDAGAKVPCEQL